MRLVLNPTKYIYAGLALAVLAIAGLIVNAPQAHAASCPSAKFVTSNGQGSWDRYADGSHGAYQLNNNTFRYVAIRATLMLDDRCLRPSTRNEGSQ